MSVGALLRRGDVVLVTFPFTDLSGQKLRPAIIVGRPSGDDFLFAFISSRAGSIDPSAEHRLALSDPEFAATRLKAASLIRLNKIATLHRRLVRRRIGRIGPRAEQTVAGALRYVFSL